MAKIKIHEIAKEMGLTSKEIIEKANELGINVKSHLSAIEENQAEMIKEKLKNMQSQNNKEGNKEKKDSKKDKKKEEAPVIIRREVIVSEENNGEKEVKKQTEKSNIGFVERNKNKNYNIVYRNKQQKPLTVNELFGIKPKEEPKPKKEEPVVEEKKEVTNKIKEEEAKTLVKNNFEPKRSELNNKNRESRNNNFHRNNLPSK